ncbi:uncharacterized protein LOC134158720 isoform X1 [Pezoporus occidentalis]|uniref:uncharacterized protein LOC134158720 isoform X1 n=1 Tax=Pezoporus occidentalis TaxID=407982 RepID=UPI002F917186
MYKPHQRRKQGENTVLQENRKRFLGVLNSLIKSVFCNKHCHIRGEDFVLSFHSTYSSCETFRITSSSEAIVVVHITQELTEALKAFCEKKAGVNDTDNLRPLMSVSQEEFPGRKSIPNHYEPYGKSKGNSNWNQVVLCQYEECSADASFAPANSYSYQANNESSSYGLRSTVLRDSFGLQTGSSASGISEWLRRFRRSASGSDLAVGGAPSYERPSE